MSARLGAVVAAAGLSRRMGREKVLLSVGSSSVLERVLDTLASAGVDERIVVVRPDLPEATRQARSRGARVVVNPRPEEEMLLSIRMGIEELPPDLEAFFVWPADHPYVRVETLRLLALQANRSLVLLPLHRGRRGHPALVGADLIGAIAAIPADQGLRHLWRSQPELLGEISVEDEGVLLDLDTPEDYQKALTAPA